MRPTVATTTYTGRTAWARNLAVPVREFVQAQAGSAVFLLGGGVAALVWANVVAVELRLVLDDPPRHPARRLGADLDLRDWVNDGLMALFFFVVGLEARRELDMGELRERKRISLPVLAGVGGMAVPVLIYLAFNRRGDAATAGASRCRPTRRSRSACWPSSAGGPPPACASSCSPSPWWTT